MLVRSAFVFSGSVRQSILKMKYQGEFARAGWHAEHLESVVREAGWTGVDVVVPVPLHRKKLRKRGFNQSEKLAIHLAKRLEVDMDQPLERIRETQSQTTLGRDERARNVDGAFAATRRLDGLSVLLVDDVATTCSTLLASAAACTAAGAKSVFAVTVATQGA